MKSVSVAVLVKGKGSITLYDGSPLIWLILALVALGLIFLGSSYVVSESSSTISQFGEGPTVTITQADLENMSKVQVGRAWVYYPDAAMQGVAEQIAERLARVYAMIPERLGLEPEPTGVVLLGGERPGTVKVKGASTFALWLPADVITGGLEQASEELWDDIYWVMPHEATEPVISARLYHDCGVRWVGDGLADYAGYVVSGQFRSDTQRRRLEGRLKSIERLINQGKTSYNLPEEFQALRQGRFTLVLGAVRWGCKESPFPIMVAGYAVSLALWLDFVDKHGEGLIKQFWQELQKIPKPNNRDVFRILDRLTGSDTKAVVVNVDLHHAAEVLRRHLAELGS
jgi:hypothetical protein